MPRVVSLYLPFFPTDRIARRSTRLSPAPSGGGAPPEPLVTVARDGGRRIVAAANGAAAALGLRPGHAVALAQASVSNLAVVDADPAGDARALRALAAWCLRYAPVVQADSPDGILIDTEGAAHLHGGEAALLADLTRRLARAGFAARAALADTPGAAWALARFGEDGAVCPTGSAATALRPLPVAALRLPPATIRALHLLGIERIGQLAGVPRPPLIRRLGPEAVERLDRAFGAAPDPLSPIRPRGKLRVTLPFAEPLTGPEALVAALARLAARLCRDLAARGEGLRVLDAVFQRVDGQPASLRIGTAAPSRDPAHLAGLVAARLPEIDPGFGIDAITLIAAWTERVPTHQLRALAEPDDGSPALAPLVDRLAVRLGATRVFRLSPVESRVPERAVRRVPALAPRAGASWPPELPRPSRIIDPPEPVLATALLPDDPPTAFVWRRIRHRVRAADGPERIHGEWWRTDAEIAVLRDYYRVEDEAGRRFWLFRHAPTPEGVRWWVHGRFA